jgi:hypothetical protein
MLKFVIFIIHYYILSIPVKLKYKNYNKAMLGKYYFLIITL